MLLEDRIDSSFDQRAEQEIGRKERIAHQHIAPYQGIELAAQQGLLVATFAATGADCRIEHSAAAQADQADDPALREPQPRLLATGLRESGLIGIGVGHDARRTRRPAPPGSCLPTRPPSRLVP